MKAKDIYPIIDRSIESYKKLYATTKNEIFLNKWEAMVTLMHQIADILENDALGEKHDE